MRFGLHAAILTSIIGHHDCGGRLSRNRKLQTAATEAMATYGGGQFSSVMRWRIEREATLLASGVSMRRTFIVREAPSFLRDITGTLTDLGVNLRSDDKFLTNRKKRSSSVT